MITKVFTVHDSKAEAYLSPFFCLTNGQAVRSFSDTANESGHVFNKHSGDFTLFLIGEYDDQKGILVPYTTHIHLGKAIEYITP